MRKVIIGGDFNDQAGRQTSNTVVPGKAAKFLKRTHAYYLIIINWASNITNYVDLNGSLCCRP